MDRGQPEWVDASAREPMRGACGRDHDVPRAGHEVSATDLEFGLSSGKDKDLRIRMAMKLGARSRPCVDQEQGDRNASVFGTDEATPLGRSRELAGLDEQAHASPLSFESLVSRASQAPTPSLVAPQPSVQQIFAYSLSGKIDEWSCASWLTF